MSKNLLTKTSVTVIEYMGGIQLNRIQGKHDLSNDPERDNGTTEIYE